MNNMVVWIAGRKAMGLFLILCFLVLLAGCKSSKTVVKEKEVVSEKEEIPVEKPQAPAYLSAKMQLTVPSGDGSITLGGTMKMKGDERIQLSVQMPIIRSEVVRLDITPDEVLLVDRMNKRYVRAKRDELKGLLPEDADFGQLQKMLQKASQPGEKAELTGRELGLPKMEKAKVKLYDFSDVEFAMTPTDVSSRYTEVGLEELIKMLPKL